MSMEMRTDIKFVAEQIVQRSKSNCRIFYYEFLQLLKSLNAFEKSLIAKWFCELNWNIGSLHVLGALQESRILTATEFVILRCKNDPEALQLILNDFLEAEHQLITNLFVMRNYDPMNNIKLSMLLDECIKRLFIDLLKSPNLSTLAYLETAKANIPTECITKLALNHINIALELDESNLRETFRNFSKWINEGVDDIQFTKDLNKKLFSCCEQDALGHLFRLSSAEHFKNWKFYLILIQTIGSQCSPQSSAFIRKYLKTRLQQISACASIASILHLLLTARAVNAVTHDVDKNIDAYALWYKQNIGEMKFVLSTEAFQTILDLLQEAIIFEMETDYLEVHATIAISPPVLCGKLVQAYKSKCKAHLADLKRKLKGSEPNQNIFIDTEVDEKC